MLDHQAKISDWDRLKERGIVPKDFRVKVSKGQEFESFLQRQNAAWEKKKKIVAMGPTRITTVNKIFRSFLLESSRKLFARLRFWAQQWKSRPNDGKVPQNLYPEEPILNLISMHPQL
jgi:hypothetical protein